MDIDTNHRPQDLDMQFMREQWAVTLLKIHCGITWSELELDES